MVEVHQIINRIGRRLILSVRVSPGAKRVGIEGLWNDSAIKIAVQSPAVEGKANTALIDFLATVCGIRKSAVSILSGEISRCKRVQLDFESDTSADLAQNGLKNLIEEKIR